MKTALEIAMERFKEEQPEVVQLTSEQKAKLKEVDRLIDSKIAEKKIILEARMNEARRQGDMEKVDKLREELALELSRLESERESRKEKIRRHASQS